ncbi:RagB/SusD family nutrient uptake outer membrane protein [Proteiniphilum sp. UBA5384]|uniref:RagB/SusD family nutrient uptake outer membrane protein n=1 Tax=Proteiniphilum sp. UBA5384 TaxID=1947279 RepID=UPI0025FE34EF|nr:RagB/SusD family nutrient uptake outer membrane protein [Proteiniphilum sp. UBA5384]
MKTKSYLYVVLLMLGLFISCDDIGFLDKTPYSTSSPENHYRTIKEFEMALIGCYDAINMQNLPGRTVSDGTYMYGLQYMLSVGTDELILNSNVTAVDRNQFGIASYGISNIPIGSFWMAYYAAIMRCNVLLDKASVFETPSLQEQEAMTQIVAETHFLRAFFYYHLASLFGGVPMNTTSSPDPQAPRESLEVIYTELIIPDLLFAEENLSSTDLSIGRANMWTAKGYLGVIYNYLAACKRYQAGEEFNFPLNSFQWVDADQMSENAKERLEDVVENAPYQLIERYDYLFRETTKSHQQEECLFTAEYALTTGGDNFPDITMLFAPGGNVSQHGGSWTAHRPTVEFASSYNRELDIRYAHNITGPYNANSTLENIGGVNYYIPMASTGPTFWNNGTGKYRHMDPQEKTIRTNGSAISVPLLRFADILLQYAESLYFMGDEVSARGYLTKVRERSVKDGHTVEELDAEYNRDDFVDELLEERSRELCYESKRRIDLFRFNRLNDVIMSLSPNAGDPNQRVRDLHLNWKPYKIWFPIPLRETGLNPNLNKEQNPGY